MQSFLHEDVTALNIAANSSSCKRLIASAMAFVSRKIASPFSLSLSDRLSTRLTSASIKCKANSAPDKLSGVNPRRCDGNSEMRDKRRDDIDQAAS